MSYGILLATETGDVWVSPESIPLSLLAKESATVPSVAGGVATVTQSYDQGKPLLPFARSSASNGGSVKMSLAGGVCTITLSNARAGSILDVYFFTISPQTPPEWGLAIWDSEGTCILTNETKTLADLTKIGGGGASSDNGIGTNAFLPGKWACIPQYMGIGVGIIHEGGTRPWQSAYRAVAYPEGSGTRVLAFGDGGSPTGVTNLGFTDGHGNVIATRVDVYD